MASSEFPVLMRPDEWRRHPDCPRTVPWELLASHERQAQRNHDQSLRRLAERGGLDPVEMQCVIEGKPYPFDYVGTREDMLAKAVEFLISFCDKKEAPMLVMSEQEEIKELWELVECQEKLLACYRVGLGKSPSDALLDKITKLKKKLNIK